MAECAVCTAPSGDDGLLCRTHSDDLLAELGQVPELLVELDITITRQSRTTAERHGSRSTTTPLAWNEHASIRKAELWSTLGAWANDVTLLGEDERDRLVDVGFDDIAGVATWLVRNMRTMRQLEKAGDAHEEIIDAVRQARRAIDRPADRIFAGPCGAELEDEPGQFCREDLYGYPGKGYARCKCGASHSMEVRRAWMLGQLEDLATHSGDLSIVLGGHGVQIGSSTIRKWAAAGRLHAVSTDNRGRKFYRIGDVLDLVYERGGRPAAPTTDSAA